MKSQIQVEQPFFILDYTMWNTWMLQKERRGIPVVNCLGRKEYSLFCLWSMDQNRLNSCNLTTKKRLGRANEHTKYWALTVSAHYRVYRARVLVKESRLQKAWNQRMQGTRDLRGRDSVLRECAPFCFLFLDSALFGSFPHVVCNYLLMCVFLIDFQELFMYSKCEPF